MRYNRNTPRSSGCRRCTDGSVTGDGGTRPSPGLSEPWRQHHNAGVNRATVASPAHRDWQRRSPMEGKSAAISIPSVISSIPRRCIWISASSASRETASRA